jgi:mannose-6-phosphate isomerase-like protein (cupin superfamily)
MTEDLPRTIENSVTGERVTFLATAEETNGEYVRIKNETSAGAPGVVMHYHLTYTEAFEVLKGRLDMCVGTKENHLVLAEGESVFMALNTAHRFWNSSTEAVVSRSRSGQRATSRRLLGRRPAWRKTARLTTRGPEEHFRAGPDLRTLGELHSRDAPVLAEGDLRSVGEDRSVKRLRPRVFRVHQARRYGRGTDASFGDEPKNLNSADGDACAHVVAVATQPPEQKKIASAPYFGNALKATFRELLFLLPGTGVKIALAVVDFHGFGVARQGPWTTWVNKGNK